MNITGTGLRDAVLVVLGNVFVIILAVRAVGYYAKREWGEMVVHLVGGVVVAAIVYFPDSVVTLLKNLWNLFAGGGH